MKLGFVMGIVVAGCGVVACSGNVVREGAGEASACGAGASLDAGVCVPTPVVRDGAAPSASAADASTTAADASEPAHPVWTADDCPKTPVTANCSSTCGGDKGLCESARCAADASLRISKQTQLPFVVRTPDVAGRTPACADACGGAGHTLAYRIAIALPYFVTPLRVRVGAPWRVSTGGSGICAKDGTADCVFIDSTQADLTVFTDEPEAPAKNVTIEEAPDGGRCP